MEAPSGKPTQRQRLLEGRVASLEREVSELNDTLAAHLENVQRIALDIAELRLTHRNVSLWASSLQVQSIG